MDLDADPPRTDRWWTTAPEIASLIAEELARGDTDFALRLLARLVADFRARRSSDDRALIVAEPASTGDDRWDALLGATIQRECRHNGHPIPAWTNFDTLEQWWFPAGETILRARTMQRTPVDFQRLGIWLDAAALETL
ncbi:MAG: hypothetical protein R2695_11385 [Acidimicrobiales bacterium]